jgi:hypothetical protein
LTQIFLLRQEHAVLEFLKANQFIEFDMMRRLQITNPQSYLTSRFASSELIMLSGCALTTQCLDSAVAALEECLHASIFTDISVCLDSVIFSVSHRWSSRIVIFSAALFALDDFERGFGKARSPLCWSASVHRICVELAFVCLENRNC